MGETKRALLVAGSRALDPAWHKDPGSYRSEQWGIEKLEHEIVTLGAGSLVIHGGCGWGPDRWAEEVANAVECHRIRTVAFDLDGNRYSNGALDRRWLEGQGYADHRQRNQAMVDALVAAQGAGFSVRAVVLAAKWSKTHGCEDLYARACGAKSIGMQLATRSECPDEYSWDAPRVRA